MLSLPAWAQSAGAQGAPSDVRANGRFAFESQPDRLILTLGGRPVAHYVFRDEKILRPYFAHVHAPDGTQVTRQHPPVAGRDAVDHATMLPGIWIAFGDISGNDFWRNKAVIRHERFSKRPEVQGNRMEFATENLLIATNGIELARLACGFTLSLERDGYLLVWNSTFIPQIDGFYFGDQEEMGFGVRVATAISEKNGGSVRSNTGVKTAKQTWGKTFDWCDYSGGVEGRQLGITVMTHPENFRSSWFHNRDYGLMVANPFGRRAFTKGDPSRVDVPRGGTLSLRWAAFIRSSPASQPPDIAGAYRIFANGK